MIYDNDRYILIIHTIKDHQSKIEQLLSHTNLARTRFTLVYGVGVDWRLRHSAHDVKGYFLSQCVSVYYV